MDFGRIVGTDGGDVLPPVKGFIFAVEEEEDEEDGGGETMNPRTARVIASD